MLYEGDVDGYASFNRGRVDFEHCIGAIAAQSLGLGDNVCLIGDR